ncbi:MAG: hypothetical protein ABJO97_07275 [Roseibium sp.]|uniref:hypothetical protein n=1 Tax=Roseibium sp. TaxID=1936156 RepID=UPI003266AE75
MALKHQGPPFKAAKSAYLPFGTDAAEDQFPSCVNLSAKLREWLLEAAGFKIANDRLARAKRKDWRR